MVSRMRSLVAATSKDMRQVRKRREEVGGRGTRVGPCSMFPISRAWIQENRRRLVLSELCVLRSRVDWRTPGELFGAPSRFDSSADWTGPMNCVRQYIESWHHSTASPYPNQAIPSSILMAPPTQSTIPKPSFNLDSQPPQMPPTSTMIAAPALRFLFAFCHAHNFGSLARSLYTLVKTVVGISLYPKARLAATCAPNCQARNGIPIKTRSLFGLFSGIASVVTNVAATRMESP